VGSRALEMVKWNEQIMDSPTWVPFRTPSGSVPEGPPPVRRVVSFKAIFMLIATGSLTLDIVLNVQAWTSTYTGGRDAMLH